MDFSDQSAARHRDDDGVGRAPAELFGDFVAEGLRAFGIEGPQIHVHESPGIPIDDLAAQPIHVVVVAVDRDQPRAVDRCRRDLALFEIVRNQNERRQSGRRRVRSDGVGQIAGGGASDGFEFEFEGLVDGDRRNAILE